jgi:asparagine N-glycosylation enzyme membrane subunit Stt3
MTYKGGISAMPTVPASIGDTYVVTTAFTNGGVTYQPGDLLIATSTDNTETGGIIDSANLKWDHVATGYSEIHNPDLTVANNTVTLTDFAGNELGSFVLVSKTKNIKIATENNNQITLDLEWDSF